MKWRLDPGIGNICGSVLLSTFTFILFFINMQVLIQFSLLHFTPYDFCVPSALYRSLHAVVQHPRAIGPVPLARRRQPHALCVKEPPAARG